MVETWQQQRRALLGSRQHWEAQECQAARAGALRSGWKQRVAQEADLGAGPAES